MVASQVVTFEAIEPGASFDIFHFLLSLFQSGCLDCDHPISFSKNCHLQKLPFFRLERGASVGQHHPSLPRGPLQCPDRHRSLDHRIHQSRGGFWVVVGFFVSNLWFLVGFWCGYFWCFWYVFVVTDGLTVGFWDMWHPFFVGLWHNPKTKKTQYWTDQTFCTKKRPSLGRFTCCQVAEYLLGFGLRSDVGSPTARPNCRSILGDLDQDGRVGNMRIHKS